MFEFQASLSSQARKKYVFLTNNTMIYLYNK